MELVNLIFLARFFFFVINLLIYNDNLMNLEHIPSDRCSIIYLPQWCRAVAGSNVALLHLAPCFVLGRFRIRSSNRMMATVT